MRRIRSEKEWITLAAAAGYDVNKFAKLANMSVRQLQREFRRDRRMTPKDWLTQQRLLVGAERMERGDDLKVIAADLKFKQLSHFCRVFKRFFKMTASQYLNSKLTNTSDQLPQSVNVAIG
jgi:AraC-like DNA-binding protein